MRCRCCMLYTFSWIYFGCMFELAPRQSRCISIKTSEKQTYLLFLRCCCCCCCCIDAQTVRDESEALTDHGRQRFNGSIRLLDCHGIWWYDWLSVDFGDFLACKLITQSVNRGTFVQRYMNMIHMTYEYDTSPANQWHNWQSSRSLQIIVKSWV